MEAEPVNLYEYEELASRKLTRMAYDYYAAGADDEITVRENHDAYGRLSLRYRVLVDVSRRDLSTTALAERISMPVMIAPTAFQKLAHPDGELATVRAAGSAGTVMILSTLATASIADVVAQAAGPVWFQLYVYKDRSATRALVEHAEACGCTALVVTVDNPLLGRRERDIRNRFHLPAGMSAQNVLAGGLGGDASDLSGSALALHVNSLMDPSLSWSDIDWLRSITKLPVVLKGIVRGDDAALAVEHGASGIIVSNHGGRQLDTAAATIAVLPEVVRAVDSRVDVFVDGGVRRGTHVIKALALGARAVMIGRPVLWGLAVDGQAGVERVLKMLREEIDQAMALCGCPTVGDITPDLLLHGPGPGAGPGTMT